MYECIDVKVHLYIMFLIAESEREHYMSTSAWTIADLAELTSIAFHSIALKELRWEFYDDKPPQLVDRLLILDLDADMLAESTEQYCECCGIVPTVEQYCDDCITDTVNWLLWEEHSKQEQFAECLHMAVVAEDTMIGKGLY